MHILLILYIYVKIEVEAMLKIFGSKWWYKIENNNNMFKASSKQTYSMPQSLSFFSN